MNLSAQNSALFSAIYRTESDFVVSVLKICGVPPQDLADVAQDVLLAVWCQFADYDVTRPIRPWLYTFAVRFARDYRRLARHRLEKLAAPIADVPHDAPSTENVIITEHDNRIALGAIVAWQVAKVEPCTLPGGALAAVCQFAEPPTHQGG
jgi:DNA-directed RNA polymerase specialized sigma24 family protein